MKRFCEAYGCPKRAVWDCEGRHLCATHELIFHQSDDREDFAQECADEDRLERQREEREQFR